MAPSLAATDEAGARPVVSAEGDSSEGKEAPRGFLKNARVDLSSEQAASPAGVRWLQYEVDRLERECADARSELMSLRQDFKQISDKYSDQRVAFATLDGKRGISIRNEILSGFCLAGGSAGLGLFPSYLGVPELANFAYVGMAISGILLLGSIFCRSWK